MSFVASTDSGRQVGKIQSLLGQLWYTLHAKPWRQRIWQGCESLLDTSALILIHQWFHCASELKISLSPVMQYFPNLELLLQILSVITQFIVVWRFVVFYVDIMSIYLLVECIATNEKYHLIHFQVWMPLMRVPPLMQYMQMWQYTIEKKFLIYVEIHCSLKVIHE